MYLLADINTKQLCIRDEEKYFAPLRTSYLFMESSINPFVDINLTFSDSSCNLFSDFVLFEVNFYLEPLSLLSKSAFLRNQLYHLQLVILFVLTYLQNYLPSIY